MDVSGESVLWEVVERHLSEAEFLCARVLRAFESSDETLATLAAGAEQRLLVQVDGLAVGGEPVQARLLKPVLDDRSAPEPRLVVACLALLSQGQRESVLAALRSSLPRVPAAAETALALHAGGYETDAWIVAKLATARHPELAGALLRLAARRGIMVPQLDAFLCSATPAVVAGAAQAAVHALAGSHTSMLEGLTRHTDASVRAAALSSALADGSTLARATCTAWAERTSQPHSQAMLWLALLDGTAAQAVLLAHLERASHRAPALFALGYSGRLAVVPRLLDAMASGNDVCKRLAGEAFSVLTGLSLHDASLSLPKSQGAASPAFEADDLDADLVPTPLDALPLPNPEAVAAWWAQHGELMPSQERVLVGKPWQLDTALEFLQFAPLRRRHALGTWLALRTRLRVDTRTFTQVQQQQLAACSARSVT